MLLQGAALQAVWSYFWGRVKALEQAQLLGGIFEGKTV